MIRRVIRSSAAFPRFVLHDLRLSARGLASMFGSLSLRRLAALIALVFVALHVAAWRASHATVRLLIERGSPIDVQDGQGRTPLALAVRACVDSYWTGRRTPASVRALLEAGASMKGVAFPSGYAEVDELLRKFSSRREEA